MAVHLHHTTVFSRFAKMSFSLALVSTIFLCNFVSFSVVFAQNDTTTSVPPLTQPGTCTSEQSMASVAAQVALSNCISGKSDNKALCLCHAAALTAWKAAGCAPRSVSYSISASQTYCLQSCNPKESGCPEPQIVGGTTTGAGSSGTTTSGGAAETSSTVAAAATTTQAQDSPSSAGMIVVSPMLALIAFIH
jgi:hypothetical protein